MIKTIFSSIFLENFRKFPEKIFEFSRSDMTPIEPMIGVTNDEMVFHGFMEKTTVCVLCVCMYEEESADIQ